MEMNLDNYHCTHKTTNGNESIVSNGTQSNAIEIGTTLKQYKMEGFGEKNQEIAVLGEEKYDIIQLDSKSSDNQYRSKYPIRTILERKCVPK